MGVVAGEEDLEAVASLLASRLHIADRRWEAGLRDRCAVFWSSGTTGSPKGIPKSHQQLLEGGPRMIFPKVSLKVFGTAVKHLGQPQGT